MPRKKWKQNRIRFCAIIFLTGALCLSGCQSASVTSADNTESAVVVEMQEAKRGDLVLKNSFVGTVMPKESVYVIPFVSGTVTEVNYGVGDYVNEGDVLFRIDDEAAL